MCAVDNILSEMYTMQKHILYTVQLFICISPNKIIYIFSATHSFLIILIKYIPGGSISEAKGQRSEMNSFFPFFNYSNVNEHTNNHHANHDTETFITPRKFLVYTQKVIPIVIQC